VNELALFAGAGGGILGGHLLGWRTVCAVEWEPYAACVLAARQNDGILPAFPIWDDVQTFDGRPWRGIVDVVSGGFPCQDISSAGKGAGLDGERSGMWREMARIIGEVRPRFAFVENSPVLTSRGLDRVLGDLAEMGFDAKWGVVSAADVGAPHRRDRIWIVAYSTSVARDEWRAESERQLGQAGFANGGNDVADAGGRRCGEPEGEEVEQPRRAEAISSGAVADTDLRNGATFSTEPGIKSERIDSVIERPRRPLNAGDCGTGEMADAKGVHAQRQHNGSWETQFGRSCWWLTEPGVGRVADGVAARVDKLKAIGNGQVPLVAATAFELLTRK